VLAAAVETGLLPALLAALPQANPAASARLRHLTPLSGSRLLRTVLFLGVVGLRRTWDLRGYSGDGLALLTGRRCAYGYHHVERFLSAVARAGGAESLTDTLATWTATLWAPGSVDATMAPPAYYVDGHRKAVYSATLLPRGLVARRGDVLGCRALVLLHDAHGHPLLATTHRGDLHLTAGLPPLVARYEQASGSTRVRQVIVDREGMGAEFLHGLMAQDRTVVTLLRSDQYAGVASFTEVGTFLPLQYDRCGTLIREVAPARFALPLPDHPGESLAVQVALVRDLRRQVPTAAEAPQTAEGWTAHHDAQGRPWWEKDWEATPTPARLKEPKLIPIVTTADQADPIALARTYFHRWPAQENVIKDFLIPLGIDTNHGYAKTPVVNSEIAKKREVLERRLANVRRWAIAAGERTRRASRLYNRRWAQAKARGDELYRALNVRLMEMERQEMAPHLLRAATKDHKAAADADLDALYQKVWRAYDTSNAEHRKQQRYCTEQRTLLRALDDLAARDRAMHELDNGKDQVMTVCKVALANLALWTRDQYFPPTYAHATWARLAPFFALPGRVVGSAETVTVTLRPFNDQQLTRDLHTLCARVAERRPHLPDGRCLFLRVAGAGSPSLDVQNEAVA
jgi:hypothetical protein